MSADMDVALRRIYKIGAAKDDAIVVWSSCGGAINRIN